MEDYVTARRKFIAEQALAMYDAWKAFDDKTREHRLQSRLEIMGFDYGTVPLDFHSAAAVGFGLGGSGLAMASAVAGRHELAASVAKAIKEARAAGKTSIDVAQAAERAASLRNLGHLKMFKHMVSAAKLATIGPAMVIEVIGGIMISIAIDQFIAILEGRLKLEKALEQASKQVDLKVIYGWADGKDQLTYFWSKAMDRNIAQEDPEVVNKVRAAYAKAQQNGFQLSSGQ
jgi:hypothetical protein